MYHFYVQGERDGKGPGTSACHYESMTEQTNTFRSTNNYHGKLTDVNRTMGSIHKDKISKLFYLYVLFNVIKTIYVYFCMDNNASTKNI